MLDLLFPTLSRPSRSPALYVGDACLTHAQLARACAAHQRWLAARGIARGARVGVFTQPAIETAVALVANAAAGVVSVPLDPKLGSRELAHVLRDAQPELILSAHPEQQPPGVSVERFVLDCTSDAEAPSPPVDNTVLLLLYTSGTTGNPKGAQLTARNMAACLDGLAEAWGLGPQDTVVHALPLFHVHGLVLGLFGALRRGSALCWVPRFDPARVASALVQHAVPPTRSVLFAVPTMHHRLADAAEGDPHIREGLAAAHLLISGSAALPQRERARIEALSGKKVLERYGLTETLILCAQRHDGARQPGTVGPPLRGVELRLVDEERRPIAAGEPFGEVAVRGPTVFAGYLNLPHATAAVLDEEGWFYTGDLAARDADGELRIVGRRATDLIKCGGYKVGAGEVESALLEHPQVREAAVVGVPDADLGERIVAYVVARQPVADRELEAHVAALLSPHKRPREIRFVGELPRNAMGKVQKHRLAEM